MLRDFVWSQEVAGFFFFFERLQDFFVVLKGSVIFFPRGCVIFSHERLPNFFLSDEVAEFFFVLQGCRIFFCP